MVRYTRAREQGYERMAEEILEISDDNYTGSDGRGDNALVQQARFRVDARRWLLVEDAAAEIWRPAHRRNRRRPERTAGHTHRAGAGRSSPAAAEVSSAGR